jgi:hypothetical protein
MKVFWLIVFVSAAIFIGACEDKNEGSCDEVNISFHGGTESHNMGNSCMNCHSNGGPGEGCFNVAGTVYDSLQTNTLSNATVRLYTEANGGGILKHTIQVDAKGNFYTTENISASGLYAAIVGPTTTQYMSSPLSTGNCNSCHGNSTDRIWGD